MKNAKWFSQQVALVTGASGGLGEQIALELARKDVQLVLVSRNKDKLDMVAKQCKQFTSKPIEVISCDLMDDEAIGHLLDFLDHHYRISIVVNNAGLGYLKLAEDLSDSEIQQMMQLNLNALIKITQHFIPVFR